MTWLRMSDTAAFHPIVTAVLEHPDADERSEDELFGFVLRLATLTAQHEGDYVVSFGTALSVGKTKQRTEGLLMLAEFAGYGLNEIDGDTQRRRFRLVELPKDLFHMISREEQAWQDTRKADTGNVNLTAVVRHRDGDACRYCGRVVSWNDRKSAIGGTYDHRTPGLNAMSPEDLVVACNEHNGARGRAHVGLTGEAARAAADAILPLWAPPAPPYYKPATREWLGKHREVLAQHGLNPPPPSRTKRTLKAGSIAPGASAPDAAPAVSGSADTAPGGVRPAAPSPEGAAPARGGVRPEVTAAADNAPTGVRPAAPDQQQQSPQDSAPGDGPSGRSADPGRSRQIAGMPNLDMPGRVGTGRGGSGRSGSGGVGSPDPPRRKKRRRGGRGRGTKGSQ